MTAYTNVTADDWVMAVPGEFVEPVPAAGECEHCHRAIQECRHTDGCFLWVDADGGALCADDSLTHPRFHKPVLPERVPLEACTMATSECPHTECPDGWHSDIDLPCSCTPDCAR